MKKFLSAFLSVLLCLSAFSFTLVSAPMESTAEAALPSSHTLRGTIHLPAIANQGHVGCCASMSIGYLQFTNAYSHYIHQMDPNSDFNPSSGKPEYNFSPKFTYNIGGPATTVIYDVLREQGIPLQTNSSFSGGVTGHAPEDDNAKAWSTNPGVWESAQNFRVKNYEHYWVQQQNGFKMTTSPEGILLMEKIKTSLNNGNVVVTGGYPARWQFEPITGLGTLGKAGDRVIPYSLGNNPGGHQVCIVGYDDNITCEVNGVTLKGAFQIANSWSTSWQNDGFVWVMYDALNETSGYAELNSPHLANRTWTLDQFVLMDWRKDLQIGMPELRITLSLTTADRDSFSVTLTRTDKETGVTEKYLPFAFKNSGMRPYSHLNFNGKTGSATGELSFNYDELMKTIPVGKTANDYVYGAEVDTFEGASLTINSVKMLNKQGETVYTSNEQQTMTGKDRVLLTSTTDQNIIVSSVPEGAKVVYEEGSSAFPKDGDVVQFRVVPDVGYRTSGNMKVKVDGKVISPVEGLYCFLVTGNHQLSVEGIVPEQKSIYMRSFSSTFEDYGPEYVYILEFWNKDVHPDVYNYGLLSSGNYPYTFRITVEGNSYDFVPSSFYHFSDSTLYRLPVADGGWFPKSGTTYNLKVEVCLNGVPVYTCDSVTAICKLDGHSNKQAPHVHSFSGKNYVVLENGNCTTGGSGLLFCDHPGCKCHIHGTTPVDPTLHNFQKTNLVVTKKATYNSKGVLSVVCTETGETQPYMNFIAGKGDASGDNNLTIEDVTLLLNYIAKTSNRESIACSPDVNEDGIFNVKDLTTVLLMLQNS